MSMALKQNSPLKIPFDRVIIRMRESGIIEKMLGEAVKSQRVKITSTTSNLNVLNLIHLKGPFLLAIYLTIISVLIFIVEVFAKTRI